MSAHHATFYQLTPMLRTQDLQGTVDFYTEVLGFTYSALSEVDGFAALNRDGVKLMIAAPNEHPFDVPAFTGSFYIYASAEDIEEL